MLDKIIITDILLRGIVGINEDEREKKQDIVINISLYGDFSKAIESDDIKDTIDYKSIKQKVIELIENGKPFLVEHLAGNIVKICFSFDLIEEVTVKVEKPGALRFAKNVGFEIHRKK